jgi:hypothetical protein
MSKLNLKEEEISISASYEHGGLREESKSLSLSDIRTIHKIEGSPSSLTFFLERDKKYPIESISLHDTYGTLSLSIRLDSVEFMNDIADIIITDLNLKVRTPKEIEIKKEATVGYRLKELEKKFNTINDYMIQSINSFNCFLSYRFNNRSKVLALELKRFLSLLNIKVIDGTGYEPRRIDEKVKARLNQSIDFIIYLTTKEGESAWTRDELAISLAKDYPIISF